MDSFEFNKIAGAILGTALGVMALGVIADIIYTPGKPVKPGYEIAVAEGGGETAGGAASGAAAVQPIAVRLASADAKSGETSAKVCLACHTFEKGQPAKQGPNLYGVLGGPAAHMEGFKYSAAMLDRKQKGINWTFEELDKFLEGPKSYVPGTLMTFGGLKKPDQRANVIAYLRTLSDSPEPLPAAAEAAPAAAEPAAGVKPAAPAGPAPAAKNPASPAGGAKPPAPQPPASETPAAGKGAAAPGAPAPAGGAAPAPAPAQ
jgi:cytochrome c